jgi:hypothetical protein
METRAMRAMEIAATTQLKRTRVGWIVPSQSGNGTYTVAEMPEHEKQMSGSDYGCTCPDYEDRGLPCKHVLAVEMTVRRELPDGTVETRTMRVTYSQPWSAYNKAQTHEKEMFLPMLADLCSTLSNPEQGRGRPRLPISDMVFACILREYNNLSARRFDSDMREATTKGLTSGDAHFNSLLRYLRSPEMGDALRHLVTLTALPLKEVETDFAVDATGFSTCRYARWYDHKWGREMRERVWVKLHAMTGVRTNVVTAVEVTPSRGAGTGDISNFIPLVAHTAENFGMREVSADRAYSSHANLDAVEKYGAAPYIPFKNAGRIEATAQHTPLPWASAWVRMAHLFAYERDAFLSRYHQRSNVETTFSMIKAKFGGALRSRSEDGQMNEVLCKVVAHNLCVLISAIHELGLETPQFGAAG